MPVGRTKCEYKINVVITVRPRPLPTYFLHFLCMPSTVCWSVNETQTRLLHNFLVLTHCRVSVAVESCQESGWIKDKGRKMTTIELCILGCNRDGWRGN